MFSHTSLTTEKNQKPILRLRPTEENFLIQHAFTNPSSMTYAGSTHCNRLENFITYGFLETSAFSHVGIVILQE